MAFLDGLCTVNNFMITTSVQWVTERVVIVLSKLPSVLLLNLETATKWLNA